MNVNVYLLNLEFSRRKRKEIETEDMGRESKGERREDWGSE